MDSKGLLARNTNRNKRKIMKKLLLILVLLFTVNSFSQSVVNTFANQIGMWNSKTSQYSWYPITDADITFTIQNGYIMVSDDNRSVYEAIKKESLSDTEAVWSAIDESDEECTIVLKYNKDGDDMIIIIYDTFCIRYYFE